MSVRFFCGSEVLYDRISKAGGDVTLIPWLRQPSGDLPKELKQSRFVARVIAVEGDIPDALLRRKVENMPGRVVKQEHCSNLSQPGAVQHYSKQAIELLARQTAAIQATLNATTVSSAATNRREVKWLVPGLIQAQAPLAILGAEKTLKTSIAVDLGISLASAGYWLGEFPVHDPVRVLHLMGEGEASTNDSIVRRVAESAVVGSGCPYFATSKIKKLDDEGLEALGDAIRTSGAGLVIIDPAYLYFSGEATSVVAAQGEKFRTANAVCRKHGATMAVVHHFTNAGKRATSPDLSQASGAGWGEFFGQWMLLSKRSEFKLGVHKLRMHIGGRAGQCVTKHLRVNEGFLGSTGEDNRIWDVEVFDPPEKKAKEQEEGPDGGSEKSQILEALKDGPLSKRDLKLFNKAKLQAFDELVAEGTLVKTNRKWGLNASDS